MVFFIEINKPESKLMAKCSLDLDVSTHCSSPQIMWTRLVVNKVKDELNPIRLICLYSYLRLDIQGWWLLEILSESERRGWAGQTGQWLTNGSIQPISITQSVYHHLCDKCFQQISKIQTDSIWTNIKGPVLFEDETHCCGHLYLKVRGIQRQICCLGLTWG